VINNSISRGLRFSDIGIPSLLAFSVDKRLHKLIIQVGSDDSV
jgi:hypothetical protein